MNYILLDTEVRNRLFPFTHTRPIADIRCGIMTMRQRWELLLNAQTSSLTVEYLQEVYPLMAKENSLVINGAVFANKELLTAIQSLKPGELLEKENNFIAAWVVDPVNLTKEIFENAGNHFSCVEYPHAILCLNNIWDIFSNNEQAIKLDFQLLTKNRISQKLPIGVVANSPEQIFVEEGAILNPCILNALNGPIYIGKDAEIMEGCMVRGPFALCEHSTLKMGAKIYGGTTIGPECKIGGEVNNSVFFAYSNKGHDGFIGNAVIGEWCNLGADTNCSNLKNNYDLVKIWDEHLRTMTNTGLTFCGLMMGDHSKTGINTMFNTGTVVGVSSNIYGAGFPEKFIPSFSWGDAQVYDFEKAMETANRMMERRGVKLTEAQKKMYQYIFDNK